MIGQWDMIIAHPPCTYLSNAGAARLFRDVHDGDFQMVNVPRLKDGIMGRDFFMQILNAKCDHIAIENPVPSRIFCLPPHTQMIQPYQFGHPYTKKTYLWLKGVPPLMPTDVKLSDLIEDHDYPTNGLVLKKEINFQSLVRCGKCALREDGRCQMQPKSENPYWFCADGERRE